MTSRVRLSRRRCARIHNTIPSTTTSRMQGSLTYNALQVQAQKRFTNGLTYLVSYTLSRTWSNTDSGFGSFNGGALNTYNQKSEYQVASNDQTHVVSISGVYELPIGPGKTAPEAAPAPPTGCLLEDGSSAASSAMQADSPSGSAPVAARCRAPTTLAIAPIWWRDSRSVSIGTITTADCRCST